MKKVKILTASFIITILSVTTVYADKLYLNSNAVVEGKILRVTADSIEFDPAGDKPFEIISRGDVRYLKYDDGTVVNMKEGRREPVKEEVRPERHSSDDMPAEEIAWAYPVLGVSLGTPAGINIITGYYLRYIGFQVTGMFFGADTLYGVQFDLLFHLYHTETTMHSIALAGGRMFIGETDKDPATAWNYGGISYMLNFHGFFLDLGLSAGTGDFESPQFMGQIGYLHRFNTI